MTCVLSSKAANLTSETTKTVYIMIWKLSPMICLIRSLFTPCITERRTGEIGTSTPVVMPILKIKSKHRQSLCCVSHVWRPTEKYKGKWWVISRCELVGCVAAYWGTTLLPFPWKDCNSNRIKSCVGLLFIILSLSLTEHLGLFLMIIYRLNLHLTTQQSRLEWIG